MYLYKFVYVCVRPIVVVVSLVVTCIEALLRSPVLDPASIRSHLREIRRITAQEEMAKIDASSTARPLRAEQQKMSFFRQK